MARILGVDIPDKKRVIISLTAIYGIGNATAKQICLDNQISEDKLVKNLNDVELTKLRQAIMGFQTEGDLRREVALNIKRLMEINSYRGLRHRKKLPTRGQHTRRNARTAKGPRKTVANKKQSTEKT